MPGNAHRSRCSKVAKQVFLVSVGLTVSPSFEGGGARGARGHRHCLGTKVNGQEKVGWHHRLSGHEQTPGDGEGQGSLVCCSPLGRKESDVTERLNKEEERCDLDQDLETDFMQASQL